MGAHASVTKRKVICKKFLLLCVDFPAQDRSPIKGAVISPFYIESSTVDIVSLLRRKVYMVARNSAEICNRMGGKSMLSLRKKLWNIVAALLKVSQNTFCEGDACFGYKKRSD